MNEDRRKLNHGQRKRRSEDRGKPVSDDQGQPRGDDQGQRFSDDRRQRLGRAGEQLAAEHLMRRGFRILERNYRTRWGELDIVACDGHTLVFCEVKTRRAPRGGVAAPADWLGPFDSVGPRKRNQVQRMAARWLSERHDRPYAALLRFDAIGIRLDDSDRLVSLEHLEDAF